MQVLEFIGSLGWNRSGRQLVDLARVRARAWPQYPKFYPLNICAAEPLEEFC